MATTFANEGGVITLEQTRPWFRRAALLVVAAVVLSGAGLALAPKERSSRQTPTSLDCDHGQDTCTLTMGALPMTFPVTSIHGTRYQPEGDGQASRDSWLTLERTDGRGRKIEQSICGAFAGSADVAQTVAFADQLAAFLQDRAHPPIQLRCVGHEIGGVDAPKVLLASLLGLLVVFLLTRQFSVETKVVLDGNAHTITASGRGWLRRAWNVRRPLAEVARIELRARIGGNSRAQLVYGVFTDGTSLLLWSPAASAASTVQERIGAMRALIGHD